MGSQCTSGKAPKRAPQSHWTSCGDRLENNKYSNSNQYAKKNTRKQSEPTPMTRVESPQERMQYNLCAEIICEQYKNPRIGALEKNSLYRSRFNSISARTSIDIKNPAALSSPLMSTLSVAVSP